MNARDLITDAVVEKAAQAAMRYDLPRASNASVETFAKLDEPATRAALEAVIDDLVGAARAADWDRPLGWAGPCLGG